MCPSQLLLQAGARSLCPQRCWPCPGTPAPAAAPRGLSHGGQAPRGFCPPPHAAGHRRRAGHRHRAGRCQVCTGSLALPPALQQTHPDTPSPQPPCSAPCQRHPGHLPVPTVSPPAPGCRAGVEGLAQGPGGTRPRCSGLCLGEGRPARPMSLSLLLKVTAWCAHVFHVRYIKYNTTMHCTFPRQPSCHFRLTHSLLRKNAALGIYKAFQLNGHKSQVSFKPNNHWP